MTRSDKECVGGMSALPLRRLLPLLAGIVMSFASGFPSVVVAQQYNITGDRVTSGRCDVAWQTGAVRYVLEATTSLSTPFALTGDVLASNGVSLQLQSVPPVYFVRVRSVGLINVPDIALRQAAIAAIPGKLAPTNEIYDLEAWKVGAIDSGGAQVRSVAGLWQFTNLESLLVANSSFTNAVDLSSNSLLRQVDVSRSGVTNLNIAGLTRLVSLNSASNGLRNLDVGGRTNLQDLYCYGNLLTNIVVTGCTSLGRLECDSNALARLDLSGCTSLWALSCFDNGLTALDLSPAPNLKMLFANNNSLANLNLSGHGALEEVYCYNNALTNIDLSGCTNLVALSCMNNTVNKLNLAGCGNLRYLYCSNNIITNLNLSGCTSLEYLRCERNVGLKTLNLAACTNLLSLRCFGNTMTGTLDITRSPMLNEVMAQKNASLAFIRVPDLANLPAVLTYDYTTTIIGP